MKKMQKFNYTEYQLFVNASFVWFLALPKESFSYCSFSLPDICLSKVGLNFKLSHTFIFFLPYTSRNHSHIVPFPPNVLLFQVFPESQIFTFRSLLFPNIPRNHSHFDPFYSHVTCKCVTLFFRQILATFVLVFSFSFFSGLFFCSCIFSLLH